jgi:hypothetical protein
LSRLLDREGGPEGDTSEATKGGCDFAADLKIKQGFLMKKLMGAVAAIILASGALAALPTSAFAQVCTCAGAGIRADVPPPPLPVYEQPPLPDPGYLWTPGYWSWNNFDYYWVPGTWVQPPQPNVLWTPGYWAFSNGIFAFNPGYWGPHVGFYGGVSYGFGYGGSGYEGGRWDNGQFFYNRAANRLGPANVTNVYNKTITVNNTTITNVSYNGGPAGTAAKPTPDEEAAAKEQHIAPTPAQVQHARTASTNEDNFNATNHGKPAIAATPKPGVFKGPGVVPAKAAAAVPEQTPKPAGVAKPANGAVAPAPAAPAAPAAAEKTAPKETPKALDDKAAPKATEEPKAVEKAAPATAPKTVEEKTPKAAAEKAAPKAAEEKTPPKATAEKTPPKAAEKTPPKAEPKATPAHAEQVRRPPAGGHVECGKPGQPACPK